MGVSAVVQNGDIVKTAAEESMAKSKSSSVNKDDFLQLLVAQMQFQDPLEPTENTEWVSQYAQFSQVEELQNMSASMELSRASSLVGQTVIMDVTDSKGNSTQVQGKVDYVSYEGGRAYLSINGELYAMDDLSLVVDERYLNAMKNATAFVDALASLPALSTLALSDKDAVENANKLYNGLSDYELSFLDKGYKEELDKYTERMANLIAIAEKAE